MKVMVNIPDELFRQIIEEKIAEILPANCQTKCNGLSKNTSYGVS